jgi:hypothetical protein
MVTWTAGWRASKLVDYPTAISDAVLAAAGFMALALLMALTKLALSRRPHHSGEPVLDAPSDQAR